jgi:hypothetical protein
VPDPIAFMVMPFGRRPTDRSETGIPGEIDFDALWFRVYRPVLQDLGYRPARADADVGSLIITTMIQRLVLGDLVVADLTLPNANVYYEVGVRHASRKTGCVLTAADWARPVFDLAQMRQVRFPLTNGLVDEQTATTARAHLAEGMTKLLEAVSPVFDGVPGYPSESDPQRASAFTDLAEELMSFDADVREAFLVPQAERRARALEVLERYGNKPAVREADALLLMRVLRDLVGWDAVLGYIATLPPRIAHSPQVMELECLAMAKSTTPGAAVKAAARLEMLIATYGETSERLGLLGGRYKQLANDASDEAERHRYVDKAISSYERGMTADLNDYYPASNLPRLYRKRGREGDEKLATEAEVITMAACQRALTRKTADEWVRPTLLGLAFDRGDVAKAQQLLTEVAAEGPAVWKIQTILSDLRGSVDGHADEKVRRQLSGVLTALEALLPPSQPAEPDDQDPRP